MRNDVNDPMLAYGNYLVPSPGPSGIYVVARPVVSAGQIIAPTPTMLVAAGVGFGLVIGWFAANHLRSK